MMPDWMPKVSWRTLTTGREAVGGAGRVGDDVVLGGVVLVVVDAEDDGEVLVGGRGGDDDLLDGASRGGPWPWSASVKKPVDSTTISAPTEAQSSLAGSRSAKTLIVLPSTMMESSRGGDLVLEVAEDGVVLEQVGEGGGGGEVVDGDEFDVRVAECGAEDVASDAAEAVDAYLDCHVRA